MAYLAVVGSKAVNGVAYIHSEIIKETIFKVPAPLLAGVNALYLYENSGVIVPAASHIEWIFGSIYTIYDSAQVALVSGPFLDGQLRNNHDFVQKA